MASKITPPLRLLVDIPAWQAETQIMTAAERGALLALKMFFWRTGPLPDDDGMLARIVGMELKDWKKARKAIELLFIVRHGEWMRQDWIDELEEAYAAVNRVKELSRKGNAARWGKRREAAESDPAGSPTGIPHGILNNKERTKPATERETTQPTPPKPRANDFQPEFLGDVEVSEAALGIGGAA